MLTPQGDLKRYALRTLTRPIATPRTAFGCHHSDREFVLKRWPVAVIVKANIFRNGYLCSCTVKQTNADRTWVVARRVEYAVIRLLV